MEIPMFTYHDDGSHGWLEVSMELVVFLEIDTEISQFSYMSKDCGTAYLEEDLDLSTFFNKILEMKIFNTAQDVWNHTINKHHNESAFIRDLPRFEAGKEKYVDKAQLKMF